MYPAGRQASNEQLLAGPLPNDDRAAVGDGAGSRAVDRRTLLVGAGALAAAGLSGPARAAGDAIWVAARSGPRFDAHLARQLQRALRDALRDQSTHAPGAILHVQSPKLGRWTGAAGLGRVAPAEPMRPRDRFRAGSIVKPFVAVAVLQLAERRRLSLDARLPDVLPASVTGRFANAADITVRMLLGHRAGIPDWDSPAVDEQVARQQTKVWKVSEFLDLAAVKPPLFAPGTSFSYSNTDYTLLGLVIERITGHSWRHEVTRRVIRPLRLTRTKLPAPGQRAIKGAHAHGYVELDGQTIDVRLDPSFAGPAGGYALVTTVQDLARFLDALFTGRLFRHRATLKQMLTIAPAQGEGGLVGYGLGIEQRAARRRRAHRPSRRGGLSLLRGPPAPYGSDDRACDERRGRPDAAASPSGQGAPGDASVNRDERRGAARCLAPPRARPQTSHDPRTH